MKMRKKLFAVSLALAMSCAGLSVQGIGGKEVLAEESNHGAVVSTSTQKPSYGGAETTVTVYEDGTVSFKTSQFGHDEDFSGYISEYGEIENIEVTYADVFQIEYVLDENGEPLYDRVQSLKIMAKIKFAGSFEMELTQCYTTAGDSVYFIWNGYSMSGVPAGGEAHAPGPVQPDDSSQYPGSDSNTVASSGTSTEDTADGAGELSQGQHVVSLQESNTIISSADMQELVNINQLQDVVINSTDGVVLTFARGTMKLIDGRDAYDFGVKLTKDYAQSANKAFGEEDFVFHLHFNYDGELPGSAAISIPVDSKWVGKILYYYVVNADATVTSQTSATVDENGIYTITQSHCSDYVAAAKAPEGTDVPDGKQTGSQTGAQTTSKTSPKTGDESMAWLYVALMSVSMGTVVLVRRRVTES